MLDPAYAGIAGVTPTVAEFGAATRGGFTFGVSAFGESYLQVDGAPVRHHSMSDERYQEFIDGHPNLGAAFFRTEAPRTFNGNVLLARQDGYGFTTVEAARTYYDQVVGRALADAANDDFFDAQPIDPPPNVTTAVPSRFLVEDYPETGGGGQSRGVSGWFLNGTDVHRLFVSGPARPPERNEAPAYVDALTGLAGIGAAVVDQMRQGKTGRDLFNFYGLDPDLADEFDEYCATLDDELAEE